MSNVKRVFVEKQPEFAVQAKALKEEIVNYLGIKGITNVRICNCYDVENILEETFEKACNGIFAEPPVDILYKEELPKFTGHVFFSEYLPGQFDQRADSAIQCVRFIKEKEEPTIQTSIAYLIEGNVTELELEAIKTHCINPVDSREASAKKPLTLTHVFSEPNDVEVFYGFIKMNRTKLKELYDFLQLAMTWEDFKHIHTYFVISENRDPSLTEIRVLDTYWSDHCRHTTFSTELTKVSFLEGNYKVPIQATYEKYLKDHSEIFVGRTDKFICLMDLALMAMRKLKKEGKLSDQEETDEINACSIVVPVVVDEKEEEWLINFKNETHNHPTEIEPFGGAATCLGGAIRDPLSGRTYVYQAMRVTGAADPTVPVKATMRGKLPQKKLVRGAAHGYSSYGNQIGLATGLVKEIYHPDYVAKRLEIGAVLGAAPRSAVIRESSDPGDIIILIGGRTGRDGCGGATGSSKIHTEESIETCGAEVQKGNPPTERKIQRLFRRAEVSRLIKKCNDFGAGGVSVAIGELADGLVINLDQVPKKYNGLSGTEIAISESQERMAVVVDKENVNTFLAFAKEENLEAVEVAVVTDVKRLVLEWRGKKIVDISREFLDTNGAHQEVEVIVEIPEKSKNPFIRPTISNAKESWIRVLKNLNVCSQKGLVEMFDSSVGAASVLMPYGGKFQMTETQSMVAKIPVLSGNTDTVTMMSFGFDPYLSKWSPYHGATYAVVESVAKIVATGGSYEKIRFTFQEYFRRMDKHPKRWSQPVAALLGAYEAQLGFGLPSIGGKDSMSGTFQDIDVPPTLVSFAVDIATTKDVITPELKKADNILIWVKCKRNKYDLPVYEDLKRQYHCISKDMAHGRIVSSYALDAHGVIAGVSKMAFGNKLGVTLTDDVEIAEFFAPAFGDIIAEVDKDILQELEVNATIIGKVTEEAKFICGEMCISLKEAVVAWESTLEDVFPTKVKENESKVSIEEMQYEASEFYICKEKIAKPTVFIPVFPGTNCEYDSKRAFERAGANVSIKVFRNLNAANIRDSVKEFEQEIKNAQIIMFPGGFSAGDEPDGSAKFFATAFQNAKLKEAIEKLLEERDGLVLGVCNGFQALVKLGLLPYGKIVGQLEDSPTLTYNTIGRHISKMVYAKVVSNQSPWLREAILGGVYANPASHGEGRFVASQEWLQELFVNGQVATQYADLDGVISMDEEWNPNGSYKAIEGITSKDGRVFGKMAHSERRDRSVAINIYGEQDLKIFEAGVSYFK